MNFFKFLKQLLFGTPEDNNNPEEKNGIWGG